MHQIDISTEPRRAFLEESARALQQGSDDALYISIVHCQQVKEELTLQGCLSLICNRHDDFEPFFS